MTGNRRRRLEDAELAGLAGPAGRPELTDWRVLDDTLCARFAAASFGAAAAFAAEVARLADEADHHPDIDLRFPGLVQIVLTTHDRDGVTEVDADLARRITDLAAQAAIPAQPSGPQAPEVVAFALEPAALAPFWCAVLAYRARPVSPGGAVRLVDPRRFHPPLRLEPAPAGSMIGGLHLDVAVAAETVAARIDAAVAAGGRLLPGDPTPDGAAVWDLDDPDGNRVRLRAIGASG